MAQVSSSSAKIIKSNTDTAKIMSAKDKIKCDYEATIAKINGYGINSDNNNKYNNNNNNNKVNDDLDSENIVRYKSHNRELFAAPIVAKTFTSKEEEQVYMSVLEEAELVAFELSVSIYLTNLTNYLLFIYLSNYLLFIYLSNYLLFI
jgi:hypothetical protein